MTFIWTKHMQALHADRLLAHINSPRYIAVVTPELRADAAAWDVAMHYERQHRGAR